MPAALLFYHAISPTYNQSFNYGRKRSAPSNFVFTNAELLAQYPAVCNLWTHDYPTSGSFYLLGGWTHLLTAALIYDIAVLPFSCSNLRQQ